MDYIINNKNVSIFNKIGLLGHLSDFIDLSHYSKIAILTDYKLFSLYKNKFKKNFTLKQYKEIIIKPGENNKNLQVVEQVWKKLFSFSFDRNSLLINFGGGMISDLGGFAAATYMRGIDFINIPTTLLAQVDAAIGGKTAVNFNSIKNSIGLFVNPVAVLIDTSTLKSLPEREILSGFAEILKYGIVFDRKLFNCIFTKPFLSFDLKELQYLIKQSYLLKIRSIQRDFCENSSRKILNFGHTIGHAFEAISMSGQKPLTHGEAVAIGMIIESEMAAAVNLLHKQDLLKIKEIINKNYSFTLNDQHKFSEIFALIKFDKKNRQNNISWTLPVSIGKALYNQTIPEKIVFNEISKFLATYSRKNVK